MIRRGLDTVVAYWPGLAALLVCSVAVAVSIAMVPDGSRIGRALSTSAYSLYSLYYLEEAVRENPDRPELLLDLAAGYLYSGQQATALQTIETYLEVRPNDGQALAEAAKLSTWQLQPEIAAGYYERVRSVLPGDIESRRWLIDYYMWKERRDSALETLEELTNIGIAESSVLADMADVYAWLGSYDKAIDLVVEAERFSPDIVDYPLLRGRILRWVGRDLSAVDAYERAVQVSPNNIEAWTNLVELYSFVERYEDSESAAVRLAQLQSGGGP